MKSRLLTENQAFLSVYHFGIMLGNAFVQRMYLFSIKLTQLFLFLSSLLILELFSVGHR